jgi:cyanophycin synthetase
VIVDYAHNAAAIEGLVDLVLNLPARKRMVAITVPGDRRDEDVREAGSQVAPFDFMILREDVDRRGREPGEIATLLREGLIDAGVPENRMVTILDEAAALKFGVDMLEDDDILVVLADKVPRTLNTVRDLLSAPPS